MQRQCNSTDNTGHAASVSDSVGQRHKPQHSKKSLEAKDVSLYKPFRAEYSELWIDDGIGIHCGHSYCIPSNKQSRTWHRYAADACNNNAHMRPCRFISALHFCYLFPQWDLGKHCWRQLQCFQKRRIGILRRAHRRRAFRLDISARKKASFYEYAAVIVPAIPLAHAIGRIGCFLAGCCYGRIVDTPISVCYHNPIGGAPVGVPVFPIQLVESACNILVFVILLIYTRKRLKAGSVLFLYAILYGIERFCLEYFRADEIRGIFLGLSTSQWISIAMIIFGIVGFVLARRRENRINKVQSGEQIQTEPLSDNIHSENSPSNVGWCSRLLSSNQIVMHYFNRCINLE